MNRRVVIFGLAEWTAPLPTNQHHLARQMAARGYEVLFVDTIGTRRPVFHSSDFKRIFARLIQRTRRPQQVEPGIRRLSPIGPPPGASGFQKTFLQSKFCMAVNHALESLEWERPIGWFFNPRASFVLEAVRFSQVVFHLVDDLRLIPGSDVQKIEAGERALAQRANLTLASAPALYERLKSIAGEKTHYFRNVVDLEHFARSFEESEIPKAIQDIPHPRIIYSGNLTASKVDYELLENMIRRREHWHWVFIGEQWAGETERGFEELRKHDHVHHLGHVDYAELPRYLAGGDVLMIPYRTDAATESVCPLKFLEYAATGKPIVATPLPALQEFGAFIPLAATAEEFVRAIEKCLVGGDSEKSPRLGIAREYTWERRMNEIEALLKQGEQSE